MVCFTVIDGILTSNWMKIQGKTIFPGGGGIYNVVTE